MKLRRATVTGAQRSRAGLCPAGRWQRWRQRAPWWSWLCPYRLGGPPAGAEGATESLLHFTAATNLQARIGGRAHFGTLSHHSPPPREIDSRYVGRRSTAARLGLETPRGPQRSGGAADAQGLFSNLLDTTGELGIQSADMDSGHGSTSATRGAWAPEVLTAWEWARQPHASSSRWQSLGQRLNDAATYATAKSFVTYPVPEVHQASTGHRSHWRRPHIGSS